jgi:predicted glycosyltransferase
MMNASRRLAYFVSSHGFGHATRASAVMQALLARGNFIFEVFTEAPHAFFQPFGQQVVYHRLESDIGVVQRNAFEEDIPQTLRRLANLIPFNQTLIRKLAAELQTLTPACEAVLCDIDPMGISVAKHMDIPSVLIENFTWDWIYQGFGNYELESYGRYLKSRFESADHRLQVQPLTVPHPRANLTAEPVAREASMPIDEVKIRLGITSKEPIVLVNLGGSDFQGKDNLVMQIIEKTEVFVILAGSNLPYQRENNLLILKGNYEVPYPDLVNAADAIIAKLGYSTLAEVYHFGTRYGFVARAKSRESESLRKYALAHTPALEFTTADLQSDEGLIKLHHLLLLKKMPHATNGAKQVADYLLTKVLYH